MVRSTFTASQRLLVERSTFTASQRLIDSSCETCFWISVACTKPLIVKGCRNRRLLLLCLRPNRAEALSDDARLTSVWRLSVCRVHSEYSWRPHLLEARRAGRCRRKACWAAACGVEGRRHIVASSRTAWSIYVVSVALADMLLLCQSAMLCGLAATFSWKLQCSDWWLNQYSHDKAYHECWYLPGRCHCHIFAILV